MRPCLPVPTRRILTGAAAFFLALGCGVADYEAQMAVQQERVKYLDEEARSLAGPIRWPDRAADKEGDAVPAAELFFRPPRGVATDPDPKPLAPGVYQYKGSSESGGVELVVAAARGDKGKSRDAFRAEVLRALNTPVTNMAAREFGDKVVRRKYDAMTAETATGKLHVHFAQEEPYQVAVAFRVPAAAGKEAQERLNVSLGSLLLGNPAAQRHQAFKSIKPGKK